MALKGFTVLIFIALLLILTPGVVYAAVNTPEVPISDFFDYPVGWPDGEGYYHGIVGVSGTGWGFLEYNGKVFHPGEDWNGKGLADSDLGDPVYAVSNGLVISAFYYNSWGNIILIEHHMRDGTTVWSQYAHLKDMWVKSGDTVQRGQKIGTIGKGGGNKYPAHLHFEIRRSDLSPNAWPNGQSKAQILENYYSPSEFIDSYRPQKLFLV